MMVELYIAASMETKLLIPTVTYYMRPAARSLSLNILPQIL
jgi:hypothetical protein